MMSIKKKSLLIVLLGVLLVAGCAAVNVNLPSITTSPTGQHSPGKIVWRDLLTNDPAASRKFYGELFGWSFENIGTAANLDNDTDYVLIRHNGKLIGGMIDTVALNKRTDISQWVVSMSVPNLDAAVKTVQAEGGTIVTPATSLQARGRLALVRDAQGALIGLLQTRDGDPDDTEAAIGDFLWEELWTTDVDKASTFYRHVGGLEADTVDRQQVATPNYVLLKNGPTPRAGIMANPLEGLDPVWVSYIRVSSPAEIADRVADLGGRVIVDATSRAVGGEAAFIAGPSGAGIALQTWPLEKQN